MDSWNVGLKSPGSTSLYSKPPHYVREVITSTTSWKAPKDFNNITFKIWVIAGGGGGSGNYYSGGNLTSGYDGGAGGNAQVATLSLSKSSYMITIGQGGAGGAGTPSLPSTGWGQHYGQNGGNSSFDTLVTATGGKGGTSQVGAPGTSTGGVVYPELQFPPGCGQHGTGAAQVLNTPGTAGGPGIVIIEYTTIDPTK